MKMRNRRKLTRPVDWWVIWVRRMERHEREGRLTVEFHAPGLKLIPTHPGAVISMGAV